MVDLPLFTRDALMTVWIRHRLARTLHRLSDRFLADMGVERAGIDRHVALLLPWPTPREASCPRPAPSLQGCG